MLVYTPGLVDVLERDASKTPAETAEILKPLYTELFNKIKTNNPNSNIIFIQTALRRIKENEMNKPQPFFIKNRNINRQNNYRTMNSVLKILDNFCDVSGIASIPVPRHFLKDDGLHLKPVAYYEFIRDEIHLILSSLKGGIEYLKNCFCTVSSEGSFFNDFFIYLGGTRVLAGGTRIFLEYKS